MNTAHPIKTIAQCDTARLFFDGFRYYIESGQGKKYKVKCVRKDIIAHLMDTAAALRWNAGDLNKWLESNFKKYIK